MLFILQSATDETKWHSESNCREVLALRSDRRQCGASEKPQLTEDDAYFRSVSWRDLPFRRLPTN
jgi:hypothetical protein